MNKKLFAVILSAALACTVMSSAAFAGAAGREDGSGLYKGETIKEIAAQVQDPSDDPFDFTTKNAALRRKSSETYPESYDLRKVDGKSYVTPVKFQNPFGTCWGFAAIAAAETSILGSGGEVRGDYTPDTLDLSEKHLVYFVTRPIEDKDNPQYGEGMHAEAGVTVKDKLNRGGFTFLATSLFASGLGPVVEDDGTESPTLKYMGAEQSKEYRMVNGKLTEYCYDDDDDWSLPEEYRFLQTFELKESYMLPSPAVTNIKTDEYTYNPAGTEAIKKMLLNKRAVQIAFCADTSMPGQEAGDGVYISRHWAHYTYEVEDANHAVTIVGWDDNYPAKNFVEGHEPKDEDGNLLNGAWLVKNSWGSEEEEFPNRGPGWGLENEEGEHTGYFWLSYYDKSLNMPEALAFDRNNQSENEGCYIDAHDYMPPDDMEGAVTEGETKMSNVFKAGECELLEGVSCQTTYPGTRVECEVYLLPDEFSDPTDGILMSKAEGEYEYGGFHKMDLESSVLIQKGQYYSIVQTQTTPEGRYSVNMPVADSEAFAKTMGSDVWIEGVVNEKESYIYADGKWNDYSDKKFIAAVFGDSASSFSFDNFPIKGYCRMQPDINIVVRGTTSLSLNAEEPSLLRVVFKGHDGYAVQNEVRWTLSEGGEKYFNIVPDPEDPFKANVTALAMGSANLFVTVPGAGTTVVPLSVSKKEISSVVLKSDVLVYNGKAQKPVVVVYDGNDDVVPASHYNLTYRNNKKCGTAKIIVKAKSGDEMYAGETEAEFVISPKRAVIRKLSPGKNKLTITVKNQKPSGVTGYEVYYRIKGTSAWKKKTFKAGSGKLVLRSLKKGKKYQVKVRAKAPQDDTLSFANVGKFSKVRTSRKIR